MKSIDLGVVVGPRCRAKRENLKDFKLLNLIAKSRIWT